MIRALALSGLALTAGCAQLAGLDSTSGDGRTSDSLSLQRMSVGATVTTAPVDLTGLSASYLVGDPAAPTRLPATSSAAGTWQADLDSAAPIEFTLPDLPTPIPRLYSFPNPSLKLLYAMLEHPNHTPAPASPANINLTVPLEVATTGAEAFAIYTLGSWTSRGLAAAELPVAPAMAIGPIVYDFTTSGSITGRPLEKLTRQDAYLVLRYLGAVLDGVAEAPPFDQTGNDTVTTATMTKVTADQTLDVVVAPTTITSRYTALRPAVTGVVMNWSVVAAPGYKIASNAGPALNSGAVAATDTGIAATYGNPFVARGWNTLFTLGTSASRSFTPANTTTPVTLFAGMSQLLEPAAGAIADLPAGLALTVSFNGTLLVTDGTQVPVPTSFVKVVLTTDKPTAAFYTLQVIDLLPNADSTALTFHVVYVAASDQPTFSLPPEVFQAGHCYTLRSFSTVGGYPSIASGDLTDRGLPLAQSFFDSAVIEVTP